MEIKTCQAEPSKPTIAGFNTNAVKTLVNPTAIITVSRTSRADIDRFWVKLLVTAINTSG